MPYSVNIEAIAKGLKNFKKITGRNPDCIYLGAPFHRVKSLCGIPVKIDATLFLDFAIVQNMSSFFSMTRLFYGAIDKTQNHKKGFWKVVECYGFSSDKNGPSGISFTVCSNLPKNHNHVSFYIYDN